ncbi:MAG: hypothetical protein AB7O59_04270 [Pirellulales bacterium]
MPSLTPVGTEVLVNDLQVGNQQTADQSGSVAILSSGDQVVVYSGRGPGDTSGVFARVLDGTATPKGATFRVNTTIAGEQAEPTVVAIDAGFVVAWSGRGSGDRQGVFARRFDAAGNGLGDEMLVNTTVVGNQSQPAIAAADDGRFVVAWCGNGPTDLEGVYLRVFAADGTALSPQVLVNSETRPMQTSPSIAISQDRQVLISWSSRGQDGSGWGIYTRRFSLDAQATSAESLVNTNTVSDQKYPAAAFGPNNDAVIAWSSRSSASDDFDIVAQRFAANRDPIGVETAINDTVSGSQIHPQVATTPSGASLIVWTSTLQDGSGLGVFARAFDSSQVPTSEEVPVNTTSVARQSRPAVDARSDGGFTIVWSGEGRGDHRGVFSQQFSQPQPNVAPDLLPIANNVVTAGQLLEFSVTATDANLPDDILTFFLDPDQPQITASLVKTTATTAIFRWTPPSDLAPGDYEFTALVTDAGIPALSDAEQFTITVAAASD